MLDKYRVRKAIGDGNCAYNAFILGFCDLVFSGALDSNAEHGKYELLLKKLGKALEIPPTWIEFKNFLQKYKEQPNLLQMRLAPIFRKLSIKLKAAETTTDIASKPLPSHSELEAFQAEFRDYLYAALEFPIPPKSNLGDIYSSHDQITAQFEATTAAIKNTCLKIDENRLDQVRDAVITRLFDGPLTEESRAILTSFDWEVQTKMLELVQWFEEKGYGSFLANMKKSGKWAGDIELGPLAAYLGINLKCLNSEDYFYSIYSYHGQLSTQDLTQEQIQGLKDRGIVDSITKEGALHLFECSKETVLEKLQALPEYVLPSHDEHEASRINSETVFGYWVEEFNKEGSPDRLIFIPEKWYESTSLISKLLERGVLNNKEGKYYFIKDQLDANRLFLKLSPIPGHEEIYEKWITAYEQRPLIALSNPFATHWNYLQPKDMNHWDLSDLDITPLKTNLELDNFSAGPSNHGILNELLQHITSGMRPLDELISDYDNRSLSFIGDNNADDNYLETTSIGSSCEEDSPLLFTEGQFGNSFSNHYDTFGFLGKKSPDTSSPPYKKTKRLDVKKSNESLKKDAKTALESLENVNKTPLINELTEALTSCLDGKLNARFSFLLADYQRYAAIKKYACPDSLPPQVIDFMQKYLCEVLHKSQKILSEKVMSHYIRLLFRSTDHNNKTITLLHEISTALEGKHDGKGIGFPDSVRDGLDNFSMKDITDLNKIMMPATSDESTTSEEQTSSFDQLYSNLVTASQMGTSFGSTDDKKTENEQSLQELQEDIFLCKLIVDLTTPKTCATTILTQLDQSDQLLKPLRQVFEEISLHNNFDSLTREDLKNLLDREEISNKATAKAVRHFTKLFEKSLGDLLFRSTYVAQ